MRRVYQWVKNKRVNNSMKAKDMYYSKSNPISIGRITSEDTDSFCYADGAGKKHSISLSDSEILRKMNGKNSVGDIAGLIGCTDAEVNSVHDRFEGEHTVTVLENWNKFRWCEQCKVHLNSEDGVCPDCGKQLQYVPLSPPCDPWICFEKEREFILDLLEKKTGIKIPISTMVFANTIFDEGIFSWEIVMHGEIVATLRFEGLDPDGWQMKPAVSFPMVATKLAENASVSWDEKMEKTISACLPYVNQLVEETASFINEVISGWEHTPILFFSGGKESMVMAEIFRQLDKDVSLVYAGVGLDFPEEGEFIRSLRNNKWFGPRQSLYADFPEASLGMQALCEQGLPTIDNTWCREVLKYPSRSKVLTQVAPEDEFIIFEGSRWYETDFRRSHPRIQHMRIPGYARDHHWALPLVKWNSFSIWVFTLYHKLPVNPLYMKGFQRTTCWICPLIDPYHIHQSQLNYPELWKEVPDVDLSFFSVSDLQKYPL